MSEERVSVPAEEFRLILLAAAAYCQCFSLADHMELDERIALRQVEEAVLKHSGQA